MDVSAPSSAAVALIVGMGTITMGSILSTLGYFARRFLTQQASNHADTLEALDIARDIQYRLPRIHKRVRRLEKRERAHRKMHTGVGAPRE